MGEAGGGVSVTQREANYGGEDTLGCPPIAIAFMVSLGVTVSVVDSIKGYVALHKYSTYHKS